MNHILFSMFTFFIETTNIINNAFTMLSKTNENIMYILHCELHISITKTYP